MTPLYFANTNPIEKKAATEKKAKMKWKSKVKNEIMVLKREKFYL